jgi:hypothetical protein
VEDDLMRKWILLCVLSLFTSTSCNDPKKPSETNFKRAINQYLQTHERACVFFNGAFPVDIPVSELHDKYGIAPQLAALERAGLLRSTDTTAVVHGLLDAFTGPKKPEPVKQYEVNDEGKTYYQHAPGVFGGQVQEFCYAQKSVYSIVKWSEPMTMGGFSATDVTYTYQVDNFADWAKRPEIQQAFPDVKLTINQAETTNQSAGLHLTNQGWEVNGQ